MKRVLILLLLFISFSCISVEAKQGCCSGKGGVAYCGANGHYYCKNGDPSPSCTCGEPDYTTYEEDLSNGNLYYEDGENSIDTNTASKGLLAANMKGTYDEDDVKKYFGIGTILLLAAGGSYSVGKYIGKKSKV